MISILKFLFRVLGYGFLAVAIIAGISDASTSIAQSQVYIAPLGDVWLGVSPQSLSAVQAYLQQPSLPDLWGAGLETILKWPVWAVLAPIGLVFLWLGVQRRSRRVQFA